jgi:hypothetical protein
MTNLCFVATFAALLALTGVSQGQIDQSRYFSTDTQFDAIEAVVRISILKGNDGVFGSGVCIGSDGRSTYILTCAHVIEHAAQATSTSIEFFTRASYPKPHSTHTAGFRFWVDRKNDLGLIQVSARWQKRVNVCPFEETRLLQIPVLAVGCGMAAPPSCQVGNITHQDGVGDLVVNRGACGGRSGGALISKFGLTGIIARGGDDRTHAVNHMKIHQFLKKVGHEELLVNTPPPPAAATTWTGLEALRGLGKVTLELHADGTVRKTDGETTVTGAWNCKGSRVVMVFADRIYLAEIKERTMSGAAQLLKDGKLQGKPWIFATTRR